MLTKVDRAVGWVMTGIGVFVGVAALFIHNSLLILAALYLCVGLPLILIKSNESNEKQ